MLSPLQERNSEQGIYVDNNATTRCLDAVIQVVTRALGEQFGNPSSAHGRGYLRAAALEEARAHIEDVLGAPPGSALFTSGGTEANNLVLRGVLGDALERRSGDVRLITSTVEHSSVAKPAEMLAQRGLTLDALPVTSEGVVRLDVLERLLEEPTTLVSIQWANSETGVLQPIQDIAALCRAAGVPLHTDAAQAVGREKIDVAASCIDYLTFSAHKLHAPPGVGVLIDVNRKLPSPLTYGGGQEGGLRPGTENLPAILGLRTALELREEAFENDVAYLRSLRERFEALVCQRIPECHVNAEGAPRVCNTSNMRFPGLEGQALVSQLSERGVYCSQTSACTSRTPTPSRSLLAMGLSKTDAFSSVRFSFSILNNHEEIDQTVQTLTEVCRRLRGRTRTGAHT